MNFRIKSLIGLTVLSVFGSAAVNAATPGPVVENTDTGHWYQIFAQTGVSWDDAKTAVDVLPQFMGVDGHLATITSEAEDVFIEGLRVAATLGAPEVWVGGVQPSGSAVGADWAWENGEGAISTPQVPLPSYSNWLGGEPNDAGGGESHLGIGLFGLFGWNDEGNLGLIGGYVVEYDVPRVIEDCDVSAGGCETIAGHTLTFPDGAIPAGTTITFNDFEFTDDPARCGVGPLVIFGDDTDPAMTKPDLIIPAYLCGSPKFVVIALDTGGFALEEGTVLVENDTATVLPGNEYPDGENSICENSIVQNFPVKGDPQYQDVVVWQTTDPGEMLETTAGPGVGGAGQFAGAAGEFTNECGSSRARTKGGSYFVIGLHVDFGPGFEWGTPGASNTAGNLGKFVELTRYKLELALQSLKDAKADGAIKNGDFKKMEQQLKNAIKKLDRGNYVQALAHVNKFLKFVNKAKYTVVSGENHNGEHLMRGGNIEFMLRVKIIPYAGP